MPKAGIGEINADDWDAIERNDLRLKESIESITGSGGVYDQASSTQCNIDDDIEKLTDNQKKP